MSRSTLWALLILVLLPAACQWPDLSGWLSSDPQLTVAGLSPHGWTGAGPLPGMPWIDGNAGATLQSLGGQAASQWLAGTVPWWNHYSGLGMPLAGEMQPAAFLLPFVLLLRVAHGLVLLKIAMQVVAGLSMWALLRRLGIGRVAALAGGVLFELNGTFAWFGDSPMLPVAFMPLLLLGIERARNSDCGWARGWAVIAIAVAGLLVSGFPETAYIGGILGTVWAVLRLAQDGVRARLILRLAIGFVIGLLIAAPVVLAFAQFLQVGWIGGHISASPPLRAENWAQMLFPDVFGPPLANYVTAASNATYWWYMGGYLPLLVVFLALIAVAAGRRAPDYGLRCLLAGWIAVALACAGGLAPARLLFDVVPFIRLAAFSRYATPSWELAACILAAFALDDIRRHRIGLRRVAVIAVACIASGGIALIPAWAELTRLAARPGMIVYSAGAIGWAVATVLIAVVLLRSRYRLAPRLLAGLAALDATILFVLPTFCGLPDSSFDRAPVAMLRDRLGLHRAYSLGPVSPNYGAWFDVAMLDHKYLPVPALWAEAIRDRLDPDANLSGFDGTSGGDLGDAVSARADAVSAHRDAFASLGVSVVLAPSGRDVFGIRSVPVAAGTVRTARPIGRALTGSLPSPGTPVERFAINAATYAGSADGVARLTLCEAVRCVVADADLATARDNAMLAFAIDPPLPGAGPLTWTLEQANGTHPFAVWLSDGSAAVRAGPAGRPPLRRIYDDGLVAGYALDQPAEYFDTAGRCAVVARDWTAATLTCAGPATLIRRELSFPGWRATVGARPVPVGTADKLFQTIEVPAGISEVRFRYAPPGIVWAWIAMAIGLAALGWTTIRLQKPRSRRDGESSPRPAPL